MWSDWLVVCGFSLSTLWCPLSVPTVFPYKEQYCIGTWNVRSKNQGKLDMVKQEMGRMNVDIHSCHLLFDHFQFALIQGPDIPGSYAILLFSASDLASITSPIHNWVLFLLWLHPFILSGVISPLISSNILGTYWPGEFLFQYPIILPFHTVHGVLKARILKWFAIPFSSGPHCVRPLHHDLSILCGPTQHGLVSLS